MPGVGLDIVDSPRAVLFFPALIEPVPDDHWVDALADNPHLAKPHLPLGDLRAEELADQPLQESLSKNLSANSVFRQITYHHYRT